MDQERGTEDTLDRPEERVTGPSVMFQWRHRFHAPPGASLPSLSRAVHPGPRKSHGLAARFCSFWIQTVGALLQEPGPRGRHQPVPCSEWSWLSPGSYALYLAVDRML